MPMQTAELTETDLAMMRCALELAEQAGAMGEVPVGAVVYRGWQGGQGGRILGQGHNLRETRADPTAHAEIIAIRAAAEALGTWRLDDCSIAVTLEPCPMCAGALVNARMGRLIYGCTDLKMGCVHTLATLCTDERFNHRLTVIGQVMADPCARLLGDFFQARRGLDRPAKPRPDRGPQSI